MYGQQVVEAARKILAHQKPPGLSERRVFLQNLVLVHHIIKASENLLEVALANTKDAALSGYFFNHLDEERGHERWLAEDLATAGIDVKRTGIPRQIVEMVGSQYYLIHHVDPVALLGYMVVLECFPTPPDVLAKLEVVYGKDLCRTLSHHTEHDPHHGADLLKVIDGLAVDRQSLVMQSATQTARYLSDALSTLS